MLGIRKSRDAIEDPISNYNVNTFNAIGKLDNENDGSFDEEPVYNYANTLIIDLFNVEGQSDPVRGIEKEGALILGAWMRVYEDLYNVLRYCGAPDAHADPEELLQLLDRVAALWIGRLQSYGDNTRGTMLYNLAERTSIHFNQEHGEAEVNTKFLFILNEMKAMVDNGECFDDGSLQTGYHVLYKHFHQIVGVMNIPLIQNLIHYIAFDADPKLIELYVLALMPQLRSCNEDYFDFFISEVGVLSSGDYIDDDLLGIVENVQLMYSCLGVTCKDVGTHATGIGCDDENVQPIHSLAGYIPTNNVRNVSLRVFIILFLETDLS